MASKSGATCVTVTARLSFSAGELSTQPAMSRQTFKECRQRTLKYINSRTVMIAICTLVVIECACVLAELMVDLQGIRFRFENEEKEIMRFVDYLKTKYPDKFTSFDGRTIEDILQKIQEATELKSNEDFACAACSCSCQSTTQAQTQTQNQRLSEQPYFSSTEAKGKLYPSTNFVTWSQLDLELTGREGAASVPHLPPEPNLITQTILTEIGSSALLPAGNRDSGNSGTTLNSLNSSLTGSEQTRSFNWENIFVLEINNVKESFFLVAEYAKEHVELNDSKHKHYYREYDKIHNASTTLHIVSLVILSVMVLETLSKLVCVGSAFLKKKFEVFDAFIVISSFALDFVFLDSRWYETGKDAATILVLLLPWRVVRIVNSFLMTMKHKHHIEMMTMKRAKKRADIKIAKLQALLTEIRKDVQLLVALCRNSHLPETDITACLYGLGRKSTTLTAVTSCTTIMLVSALGKDASVEDEIYGRLFADALHDPVEQDDGSEAKKAEEEAIDAAIKLEKQIEQQQKKTSRSKPRSGKRRPQVTRSYTVPRRNASIDYIDDNNVPNVDNGSIFYVNDGFATPRKPSPKNNNGVAITAGETLAGLASGSSMAMTTISKGEGEGAESSELAEGRLPAKYHSKSSVRSLPRSSRSGQNFVTFEVTTQVTYL